jgi:hypothetical protein
MHSAAMCHGETELSLTATLAGCKPNTAEHLGGPEKGLVHDPMLPWYIKVCHFRQTILSSAGLKLPTAQESGFSNVPAGCRLFVWQTHNVE